MKKTLDIKKLILLNMPYILLGLFATNFGEAWRMAQGADASEKFLSLVAVLPWALQSFWPSLHPLDLLVGMCCGGSLRLAVYLKSKNAKKYRHGLEYGSARWGVVRKFEKGKVIVNCTKFMGYTKNEDGDLVIVPEEAEIVKLIFRLYLEGYSTGKIAKHLEEQGIKTATGQDKWHSTVIDKMLRNEKYMGDALLQKTYTVDFMTKKKVKNTGIVPQYYVEDDHEAIIPKELFYRVQEEMMRRASLCKAAVTRKKNQRSRYSSTYALTGMLICGKCGQEYRRVTWARNGKKKVVWRCSNRLTNGVKKCGESETLEENALNRAVMEAIHRITSDDMEFMENFRQNIIHVIGNYSTAKESEEYEEKIKEKQEEMVALIAENAKTGSYTPEFDERYRTIAEEINALKEAQKTARNEKWMADSYEQRIQDIDHYLSTSTCQIQEFDNDLVRRLISTIKVESSEKLLIQFQSGIVMEQEIRYE